MDVARNLDLAGGLVVDTHGDFDFYLPVLHRVGADTVVPAVNGLRGAVRIRFRPGKCGVLGGGNTGFFVKTQAAGGIAHSHLHPHRVIFQLGDAALHRLGKGPLPAFSVGNHKIVFKAAVLLLVGGEHIQVIGVQLLPGGPVNTTDQSHHQFFLFVAVQIRIVELGSFLGQVTAPAGKGLAFALMDQDGLVPLGVQLKVALFILCQKSAFIRSGGALGGNHRQSFLRRLAVAVGLKIIAHPHQQPDHHQCRKQNNR